MARDNPRRGYIRIKGALHNLGFESGRNTIKRLLIENGMDPAPLRRTTWRTFLKAHWRAIPATDFFAAEVITWRGLKRYLVLFVIDLKTRRTVIAGMSPSPDAQWVTQLARHLTDANGGLLMGSRYLIHHRDTLFTKSLEVTLGSSGVSPIRLPARSTNLNAYAKRFVRSIQSERLAHVIPLSERQLRRAVKEYTETIIANGITRVSTTNSSIVTPRTIREADRSSVGRGSAGYFGIIGGRHRRQSSFGTLRDRVLGPDAGPLGVSSWRSDRLQPAWEVDGQLLHRDVQRIASGRMPERPLVRVDGGGEGANRSLAGRLQRESSSPGSRRPDTDGICLEGIALGWFNEF
jgi:transposase InsO family protein